MFLSADKTAAKGNGAFAPFLFRLKKLHRIAIFIHYYAKLN